VIRPKREAAAHTELLDAPAQAEHHQRSYGPAPAVHPHQPSSDRRPLHQQQRAAHPDAPIWHAIECDGRRGTREDGQIDEEAHLRKKDAITMYHLTLSRSKML